MFWSETVLTHSGIARSSAQATRNVTGRMARFGAPLTGTRDSAATMSALDQQPASLSESPRPPERRLDSWKAIAAYLGRGVRTVQRWEREEGLPVHRLTHRSEERRVGKECRSRWSPYH